MESVATKVAVIGSGIAGAVCASQLARNGVSVTIFDSARGPGGRMSTRRETSEDGKELNFDHGAPYFSSTHTDVLRLIHDWEARGVVAEWKQTFASFHSTSKNFKSLEKEELSKKYVGVPGMNSICRALCHEPGVESKFGVGVGKLDWLEDEDVWSLTCMDGQDLGRFKGVVATDKNIVSPRFTGRPPPLDLKMVLPELAMKIRQVPVSPRFALMLAFENPLSAIPYKGFSFSDSRVLSWAYCDSSKPGRSTITGFGGDSEQWVVHSTAEYAEGIIARSGLEKLSNAALAEVAEELFMEIERSGVGFPRPVYKKAHRWGSAFPIPGGSIIEEKCIWDGNKRVGICGDFCVTPNVEGAILSALAASSKFLGIFPDGS